MDQVLLKGSAVPRPGQSIRVLVGEPIAVADLQQMAAAEQWPEHVLYAAIAHRIGHSLHALKARLEGVEVSEVRLSDAILLHESRQLLMCFETMLMFCAAECDRPFRRHPSAYILLEPCRQAARHDGWGQTVR